MAEVGLVVGDEVTILANIFVIIKDLTRVLTSNPGMVGLSPKWVRLALNGTIPVLFQIRFLKSPGFDIFGANLTITD